jgi:hypothetical protein
MQFLLNPKNVVHFVIVVVGVKKHVCGKRDGIRVGKVQTHEEAQKYLHKYLYYGGLYVCQRKWKEI